jgi:hypothetical protein
VICLSVCGVRVLVQHASALRLRFYLLAAYSMIEIIFAESARIRLSQRF